MDDGEKAVTCNVPAINQQFPGLAPDTPLPSPTPMAANGVIDPTLTIANHGGPSAGASNTGPIAEGVAGTGSSARFAPPQSTNRKAARSHPTKKKRKSKSRFSNIFMPVKPISLAPKWSQAKQDTKTKRAAAGKRPVRRHPGSMLSLFFMLTPRSKGFVGNSKNAIQFHR